MSDFRQIMSLVFSEKKSIIIATMVGVVAAMASIGLMSTGGYLISAAALHPALHTLTMVILAVRFFGLLRAGAKYWERYYAHRATFSILARVRAYYYEKIEPHAPAVFMRQSRGDILARIIADVESLQFFFLRILYPPIVMLFVFFLTSIMLLAMSWQFVFILFLGLIIVGMALPTIIYKLTVNRGRTVREERARISGQAVELTNGYLDLLFLGRLDDKLSSLDQSSTRLIEEQQVSKNIASLAESLAMLGTFATTWFILVIGVIAVNQGQMNGVFLAFVVLAVMTVFETVGPVASMPVYIDETRTAMSRLAFTANDNFKEDSKNSSENKNIIDRSTCGSESIIKFSNLTFSYPESDRESLKNINLLINAGEKIGIVGHSGSGKSTIFQLLLQFYQDYQGKINLYGESLSAYSPEESRKFFSVVAQENHFFHNSVRNNLLLANRNADDAILLEILEAMKLSHISLDANVGEGGMTLSGGERQRLAIARMLLKDAPIVLLDEMMTGLDGLTKQEIMTDIWPHIKDKTVLHISHNIRDLDKMDRIIQMENGQIISDNLLSKEDI